MEPVSAIASVVTLMTVCTTVGHSTLDLLRTFRKAPVELVLLSNDLNDLNAILNEVRLACLADSTAPEDRISSQQGGLSNRGAFLTQVATQVSHASREVELLDAIVKSLEISSHSRGANQIGSFRWIMKKRHSEKIQKRLRQRVQKLFTLLQVRSTYVSLDYIDLAGRRLLLALLHFAKLWLMRQN